MATGTVVIRDIYEGFVLKTKKYKTEVDRKKCEEKQRYHHRKEQLIKHIDILFKMYRKKNCMFCFSDLQMTAGG